MIIKTVTYVRDGNQVKRIEGIEQKSGSQSSEGFLIRSTVNHRHLGTLVNYVNAIFVTHADAMQYMCNLEEQIKKTGQSFDSLKAIVTYKIIGYKMTGDNVVLDDNTQLSISLARSVAELYKKSEDAKTQNAAESIIMENKIALITQQLDQLQSVMNSNLSQQLLAIHDEFSGKDGAVDQYCSQKISEQDECHGVQVNVNLQEFIDAFDETKTPTLCLIPRTLAVGMTMNDGKNMTYRCSLQNMAYIWSPKAEKNFVPQADKSDLYVGKMYQTTYEHKWGDGWIGIVELNTPKLSTILGGSRNPIKVQTTTYVIRWVKWAKQTWAYENVNAFDIEEKLKNKTIEFAHPSQKQSLNRPEHYLRDALPTTNSPSEYRKHGCYSKAVIGSQRGATKNETKTN